LGITEAPLIGSSLLSVRCVSLVQTPTKRQSCVVPGYAGYVPRVHVNNQYLGKRKTEQSRDVFKEGFLDIRRNNFSSTGYVPTSSLAIHFNECRL